MDPFSPLALAHIRVLVLPLGDIERDRVSSFLRRLQREASVVPLTDLKAPPHKDDFTLSPKTSSRSSILYRYVSTPPSEQQKQHQSPFELFREPLLVLGIIDGKVGDDDGKAQEVERASVSLRERHPRIVHRQVVVLQENEADCQLPGAIRVVKAAEDGHPALKDAMCDISVSFLWELTTYAKALQASPSIPTPGHPARSMQRALSVRESTRQRRESDLGDDTPSPVEEGSLHEPSRHSGVPATSFDQITSTSIAPVRSDSQTGNQRGHRKAADRATSQETVTPTGFGSGNTQEKVRARGRARVGIVYGSIHMMAGCWEEALRILVDNTIKARNLSDHIWHAKGLENIVVCLLLHAWANLEFQVPAICITIGERSVVAQAARYSTVIASEIKSDATQPSSNRRSSSHLQLRRLFITLPDLCKQILDLYRSHEGLLELPFLINAEAGVRLAKLLGVLLNSHGELTSKDMNALVINVIDDKSESGDTAVSKNSSYTTRHSKLLSKAAIADILAAAMPPNDDLAGASDMIALLAGVASAYAMVGLERKKALTIKRLIARLTAALVQARKLGAAAMGIHPAASLSAETGAETILSIVGENNSMSDLIDDVSSVYGIALLPSFASETPFVLDTSTFGSQRLKVEMLRELIAFSEASPDPYGVVRLIASLLANTGPNAATDGSSQEITSLLSKEEQMHLATIINRTVTVSKHLGLPNVYASYWDPFLVRGVEFAQSTDERAIIDRRKLNAGDSLNSQQKSRNPLLYDPNASRPGTATPQVVVLVQGENHEFIVTLQNPFDVSIEIESLELISEGVALTSIYSPTTLGPLRIQKVRLSVRPNDVGQAKITGCRVGLQGCYAQNFSFIGTPWLAKTAVKVKGSAQDARLHAEGLRGDLQSRGIVSESVSAVVVDRLPRLIVEGISLLDSSIMLLEGERRNCAITLRNASSIPASVFEIADSKGFLSLDQPPSSDIDHSNQTTGDTLIQPGECRTFNFNVQGQAGASTTNTRFYYCALSPDAAKYARLLTVPIHVTVDAALQAGNLEIIEPQQDPESTFLTSFDVRNAWLRPLTYHVTVTNASNTALNSTSHLPPTQHAGLLSPNEVARVHIRIPVDFQISYERDDKTARMRFLERFRLHWILEGRNGTLDLKHLALAPGALASLHGSPVQITLTAYASPSDDQRTTDDDKSIFRLGSFISIHLSLTNSSPLSTGPLIAQLLPPLSNPSNSSSTINGLGTGEQQGAEEEKRIAVAGSLQRIIPDLKSSTTSESIFTICPLLAGPLEIEAVVTSANLPMRNNQQQRHERGWLSRQRITLPIE